MSDLIDKNKTLESVTDAISKYIPMLEGDAIKIPSEVAVVIMNMPSAESEIIKCEDCKHWERESCVSGYCQEIGMSGIDEDFYCGYAERRLCYVPKTVSICSEMG